MNDISYEILDLFKKYGADKEGILKILEADSRPEVLYALSRHPSQSYGLDGFFRTGTCTAAWF